MTKPAPTAASLLVQEAVLLKSAGRLKEAAVLFAKAGGLEAESVQWCTDQRMKLVAWLSAATCWCEAGDYLRCLEAIASALDLKPGYEMLKELSFIESEAHAMQYQENPDDVVVSPRAFIERRKKPRR